MDDKNRLFSELLRAFCNSLSSEGQQKGTVSVNKNNFRRMISLIMAWDDITSEELANEIGISRRTIYSIMYSDSDTPYVQVRKKVLNKVIQYVYDKSEVIEQSPIQ